MSGYLAGPWRFRRGSDGRFEVWTADGLQLICIVESDLATTRLIAAAPDLFEAAARVLDNMVDSEAYRPDDVDMDSMSGSDYPQDEAGNYWWPDMWALREAVHQVHDTQSDARRELLRRFRVCLGSDLDQRSVVLFRAVDLMTDAQLLQLVYSCESASAVESGQC